MDGAAALREAIERSDAGYAMALPGATEVAGSVLSASKAIAAFTAGEPWLDQLLATLDNRRSCPGAISRARAGRARARPAVRRRGQRLRAPELRHQHRDH
jgi:bifunctional pyridoxal-dependent enzyme with beta-cystathionase and maltose regulon repressor activities